MSLLDRLRTYATGQRSGRPESTEVKPTPPKALERMGEVSYNPNSLFSWWSANARIYNPQDDLIGRKSMDLYDQMRRDAQVKAAMALKKGAALSTGWEVVPATDKKKDKVPAEFVEWTLKHLDPLYGSFDDCLREILTALDYGFSVTEIVLKYLEEGPYKGKYGLRTLKTRRPHDFSFDVDAFDNLKADGLKQNWMGEPLPLDKFLLYVYQREFGNWKGLSDLRSAYAPWWMKDNVWRWVGIYTERFAIPIPVGKFPPGHPFPQEIADFRQMLSNIQANTSFTFPNSFELLLQEASGRGIDIFKWLIEESNMEITRSILVPNRLGVSSEPTTGSYSQARKHFDVFMLVVDDLRRDLAEDVIQVQLVNLELHGRGPAEVQMAPVHERGRGGPVHPLAPGRDGEGREADVRGRVAHPQCDRLPGARRDRGGQGAGRSRCQGSRPGDARAGWTAPPAAAHGPVRWGDRRR